MNKAFLDFNNKIFNQSLFQISINKIYSRNKNLRLSALLAYELYNHLENSIFFENEFLIISDLNEYNRFFYKFYIANNCFMIKEKLKNDNLEFIFSYFMFYFRNIFMNLLYENKMYRNIYFNDFSKYFNEEFDTIFLLNQEKFLEIDFFSEFLNLKLKKYIQAHLGYFNSIETYEFYNKKLHYGFIKQLE